MAGKYIERIDLYSRFARHEPDFFAPVVRLDFNLSHLPERARGLLSGPIGSVADALAGRGYGEGLVGRVRAVAPSPVLDDDGNVLSAGDAVEA